jgi:hypothetical protein
MPHSQGTSQHGEFLNGKKNLLSSRKDFHFRPALITFLNLFPGDGLKKKIKNKNDQKNLHLKCYPKLQ